MKQLTDRVVLALGILPTEGYYTCIITREKIENEIVELKQSTFGFLVDDKKHNALNMRHEFSRDMIVLFTELRDEMEKTSQVNRKWDEATINFDASGEVKMNFKYPES